MKINADFVLRGAVILLHYKGVALVRNVALNSGAPFTAHNNTLLESSALCRCRLM